MNNAIETMLSRYGPKNNKERDDAVKEIIQEIVLAGLSRTDFFSKAAFYGGTCLRIFHGLDRFSEDLDFALIDNDADFQFEDYLPAIRKELSSFGIDVNVDIKNTDGGTGIQSAFVKGNTSVLFMTFFPDDNDAGKIISNQQIKIKCEIDTRNPHGGTTEVRYRLLPAPYEIQIFDESSLFSGKIHAVLCRNYKGHAKGRDFYDYLFYVGKGTKINLVYLENKLKNSGFIADNAILTLEGLTDMLKTRFRSVDFESAKEDVYHFIDNKELVSLWKPELFISTLPGLSVRQQQ